MSSINSISPDKLARLIGVAHCPAIVDVRSEGNFVPTRVSFREPCGVFLTGCRTGRGTFGAGPSLSSTGMARAGPRASRLGCASRAPLPPTSLPADTSGG